MNINIIKCEICNEKFNDLKRLSLHVRKHKMTSKKYYDKYLKKENENICKMCKNKTLFKNMIFGYKRYCSCKCSSMDIHNPFRNKEIQNKIKQTNLEKYGVENPMKNINIQEKQKSTLIKKYNIDNISKLDEIKKKKKDTSLKNWNVSNPNKNKIIKEKIRKSNNNKFVKVLYKHLDYLNLELLDKKYINNLYDHRWKCKKCSNIFIHKWDYIQQEYGKCPICYPKIKGYSIGEKELYKYINI